jgi:hypothetical protein
MDSGLPRKCLVTLPYHASSWWKFDIRMNAHEAVPELSLRNQLTRLFDRYGK